MRSRFSCTPQIRRRNLRKILTIAGSLFAKSTTLVADECDPSVQYSVTPVIHKNLSAIDLLRFTMNDGGCRKNRSAFDSCTLRLKIPCLSKARYTWRTGSPTMLEISTPLSFCFVYSDAIESVSPFFIH